ILVDCDVLEADGGTRTLSITGAFIALVDALASANLSQILTGSLAAVSVGIVAGQPLLDLDYSEDVVAAVDMNVVMTGGHQFVELQGTGEEATFSEYELAQLIALARHGIEQLTAIQREALGPLWPWPIAGAAFQPEN